MLRRSLTGTFEFRDVEAVLRTTRLAPLSDERLHAIHPAIMRALGPQDESRVTWVLSARERWVVAPVGIGLAVAIFALAVDSYDGADSRRDGPAISAQAVGDLLADGSTSTEPQPGQLIEARSASWLRIGTSVRLGLERSTTVRFADNPGGISVSLEAGDLVVATLEDITTVTGQGWSARVHAQSVASFLMLGDRRIVEVSEGEVTVTFDGGVHVVTPSTSPLELSLPPGSGGDDSGAGGSPGTGSNAGGNGADPPGNGDPPGSGGSNAGGNGNGADPPGDAGSPGNEHDNQPGSGPNPPEDSGSNAGGNGADPPGTSGSYAGGHGNGNPPDASGSNAGGNGNGNPPDASGSNAGGNGNGEDPPGNGNPPGTSGSNAGGNGNGPPEHNFKAATKDHGQQ